MQICIFLEDKLIVFNFHLLWIPVAIGIVLLVLSPVVAIAIAIAILVVSNPINLVWLIEMMGHQWWGLIVLIILNISHCNFRSLSVDT